MAIISRITSIKAFQQMMMEAVHDACGRRFWICLYQTADVALNPDLSTTLTPFDRLN